MSKPLDTHYKALESFPDASLEELREAYRRLALRWHPDKPGGDNDRFARITQAWATLKDPALRKAYDIELRAFLAVCINCDGLGRKAKVVNWTKTVKHICPECMGAGYKEKNHGKN